MAVPVLAMTHQRPETLPAVGWEPGESKADILGVGEVQTARRFCSLVGFSDYACLVGVRLAQV